MRSALTRFILLPLILWGFAPLAIADIKIAITVDDLPKHMELPPKQTRLSVARKLLSVLKKHRVPEVYGFLNGKPIEDEPKLKEVLKVWRNSGYPLGNHTFSHSNLNELTASEFIEEIRKNETYLKKYSLGLDWKYFRYPYLTEGSDPNKRQEVRQYLTKNGYKIAQVTISFDDWAWNDPYARCMKEPERYKGDIQWLKSSFLKNAEEALEFAQSAMDALHQTAPHILLLHIGGFDAEMLDDLLALYKKRGAKFIPLSEAAKSEFYSKDSQVISRGGSLWTYQLLSATGQSKQELGLKPDAQLPAKELDSLCR